MNRRGRHARWSLLVGLLLLLTLIPFAFLRSSQVPEAEAAWWNESWRYRQSIAVTNNTTQQSNVYITVNLDTSNTSKFQADCGDLRFTKQNGQLLPYYIVSGCGTASTSVHIQLDTFPAGAQTFYAYYGNPSADNGFSSNDFLTQATNYTVGGIGSEETGSSPVAYWKFDEGTGSTAHDAAGVNHGSINGATWASEDQCVSGKCLSFDGTDDHILMGTGPSLDGPIDFTLGAWMMSGSSTQQRIIQQRDNTGYNGTFWLEVTSAGKAAFVVRGTDGIHQCSSSILSPSSVNDGNWHYISAARDGAELLLYVDGKLENTCSGTPKNLDSSIGIALGRDIRNSNLNFNGLIDEVKILPYALTEDQIKAEYNLGAAAVMGTGPGVAPPAGGTLDDSLVAHWAFDEQYGQTAHDKVGNNHGTFGATTSPGSDDPTWKPAGECKVNGCLGFDGGDDYLIDSNPTNLPTGSQATWSWWSKTSFNTGYSDNAVMGESRSQWSIRQTSTVLYLGLGNEQSTTTVSFPQDTDWSYYAIVFDSGNAVFYKNGEQIGTYSFTSTTVPVLSTFYIARRSTAPPNAYNFDGSLDEVKIYNTALTADQVKQDMNAGASVAYSVGRQEANELADGAGAPPIAEWKFDEKQGTVAYDSSGNANDGTVNGATWKSGCQQGACLEFDGVDDYLSCGTSSVLTSMTAFTIEGWVKTTATTFNPVVSFSSGYSGFHVPWNSGRSLIYLGPSNFRYFSNSPTDILDGEWHHVAAVVTGSGQTDINNAKMFVDGKEQDVYSTNTSGPPETKTLCRIGRAGGFYNFGQIDHVRIYDYARTPAQIAYDYNRGAPVAHWKFDECEGTVAHDASGNENHGTINIGATGTQTTAGTCSTSGAWANGASGKFEGSLNFDGTDDYVSIPNSSSLQVGGTLSIAAWINPTSLSSRYGIFSTRLNNPSGSWQLEVGTASGGSNRVGVSGLSTWIKETTNDVLTPNAWNHVVYTRSSNSDTGSIYVNGKLAPIFRSTTYTITNNADAKVIGQGTSSGNLFPGQIDDVRLYNYALSPAQVQKVYNQGYGVRYGN